jgi:hypothetical protein
MTERLFTHARVAGVFTSLPQLTRHEVERLGNMDVPMSALMGPPPLRAGHVVFGQHDFELEQHCPPVSRACAPSFS